MGPVVITLMHDPKGPGHRAGHRGYPAIAAAAMLWGKLWVKLSGAAWPQTHAAGMIALEGQAVLSLEAAHAA